MSTQIPKVQIPTDVFLYAVHESAVARAKNDGTFNSHLRFTPFLMGTFKAVQNPELKDLSALIDEIASHYAQTVPQMRKQEPITTDTLPWFSNAFSALFADLNQAFLVFCGHGLLAIPLVEVEFSNRYPLLAQAIQSFHEFKQVESLVPFVSRVSAENTSALASEQWDLIANALYERCGSYAEALLQYAFWKYREKEEVLTVDYRVRPPVGELFQRFLKEFYPFQKREDRSARNGHGGSTQQKDRPPHEQKQEGRPLLKLGSETLPPKSSEGRRESPSQGQRKHEHGSESKSKQNFKPSRDYRKPDRRSKESSEEQLAPALAEVDWALAQLKTNSTLKEVALKPTNSYLRRAQHSYAVEAGFDSESQGEEKSRHVVVKRRT